MRPLSELQRLGVGGCVGVVCSVRVIPRTGHTRNKNFSRECLYVGEPARLKRSLVQSPANLSQLRRYNNSLTRSSQPFHSHDTRCRGWFYI